MDRKLDKQKIQLICSAILDKKQNCNISDFKGKSRDMNPEPVQHPEEAEERSGVQLLKSWLNKNMKVEMSDGRVLVGIFLCTDK